MKTEFLKSLGLSEDVIAQIQAESGKDVHILAKAAGDTVLQDKMQNQINLLKNKYVDFSKKAGLSVYNKRLTVSGYRQGGTGLTSAAKNDLIKQESAKNITAITDKAIDRVPQINIDGFTVEQNAFVQKQHQELLQYSKVNNGNKEVAFVFRKGLADRTEYFGTDDKIDFGNALTSKGNGLFVMHNHPRNSSFSDTDIATFLKEDAISTLSVVKNSGDVEVITKTQNFNKEKILLDFSRQYKKCVKTGTDAEIVKAINMFLSKNKEALGWIKT